MKRALLVARFLLTAALVAWLLLVPLSFVGKAYGSALRGSAHLAARQVGESYGVRVKGTGKPKKDAAFLVRGTSSTVVRRPFSTWATGYLPTVCGLALVLATPVAWRRRARAALLVVLCTQVYVAARIALLLVQILLDDPELRQELPGFLTRPDVHGLLDRMTNLDREAAFFFLVPLGLWIVFTLRVEDLQRLWYAVPATDAQDEDATGS